MRRLGLLLLALGLCSSGHGWASPLARATKLHYTAPIACPDDVVAWHKLSSLTPIRGDAPGNLAPILVGIQLTALPEGYHGRVVVSLPDQSVQRELIDPSCDGLLDALTLVAAIALDRSQQAEVTPDQPKALPLADVPRRHARPPLPVWTAGATLGLHGDATPVLLPTFGIYANYRRYHLGFLGHYSASISGGQTSTLHYSLGTASFTWGAARLWACPIGSAVARFSFGVCGTAEIGWVNGKGRSAIAPNTTGGPWLAPGLGLTANAAVGPLELGCFGGVVRPVLRDRYYFAPNETIFRPRALGLVAEFRVGWVIW